MADEGAEIRAQWAGAHDQLVDMMSTDHMSTVEGATKVALNC
jgi:hypothetical protein